MMLSRVAIARRVRTVDGDGVEGGLIEFPWYPPTCRKVLWASHPRLLDYRVPLLDDLRESRASWLPPHGSAGETGTASAPDSSDTLSQMGQPQPVMPLKNGRPSGGSSTSARLNSPRSEVFAASTAMRPLRLSMLGRPFSRSSQSPRITASSRSKASMRSRCAGQPPKSRRRPACGPRPHTSSPTALPDPGWPAASSGPRCTQENGSYDSLL